MGACLSAPEAALDATRAGVKRAAAAAAAGVEASSAAARRAARKATLAKYALVNCEFDQATAEHYKKLGVIRELVVEQIGMWRAWTQSTMAMEPSVLSHWAKHCEASKDCTTRLLKVAKMVQNASNAHKEYVAHVANDFVTKLQDGIDTIDAAIAVYEAYEYAEYSLKYALKRNRKLPDEEKTKLTEDMEAAKKKAEAAMKDAVADVETKSLVPAYEGANRALNNFVKRCSQRKADVTDEDEAKLTPSATLQRANSVAYSKVKKRTYTSSDAVRIAKQKYDRLKQVYTRTDLPKEYVEYCEKLSEMKRHALAMKLVFDDFEPYINILFGPGYISVFVDHLCDKLHGYKTFKSAAASFIDRVHGLNEAINIEEYRSKGAEMERVVLDETERVFLIGKAYEDGIAAFPSLEKPIQLAQKAIDARADDLPPVNPDKLVNFLREQDKRKECLDNAKIAQTIASEAIQANLASHKESIDALMNNKDCIFYTNVIGNIEYCCKVITDAETVAKGVAVRSIKNEAIAPEVEEAVAVQEESALESNANAAAAEAEAAQTAEAEAKKQEEEKAAKAKAAEEAAATAKAKAEAEQNEKKKAELLAKAEAEAAEAELHRIEAEKAENAAAEAAEAKRLADEEARKAEIKAQKELERKIAEAEKQAEADAKAAEAADAKAAKQAEADAKAAEAERRKEEAEIARQSEEARIEEERHQKELAAFKAEGEAKKAAEKVEAANAAAAAAAVENA